MLTGRRTLAGGVEVNEDTLDIIQNRSELLRRNRNARADTPDRSPWLESGLLNARGGVGVDGNGRGK